jgi:para-nitrobenzyl esterase
MKAYFIRQFGSAGPELMAGYLQAEGNYRSAMVAASTAAIASGSLTGAELHLAKTPDIYVYRFDRALPGEVNQQKGAVHGDDVGFTFGFFPEGLDWSEADRKLSSDLLDYWVAFAKTGRPEVGGLPDWPAYSAEAHSIMRLDAPVHAGPLEQYELIKKTMKTDDYSRFSELRKQQ